MMTYLITVGLILLMLIGWVVVQYAARAYALKHPEFGPVHEEGGGGCGTAQCTSCSSENTCSTKSDEESKKTAS